jgi:hypothetical protein
MVRRIATISQFTLYRLTELPEVGKGHKKETIWAFTRQSHCDCHLVGKRATRRFQRREVLGAIPHTLADF